MCNESDSKFPSHLKHCLYVNILKQCLAYMNSVPEANVC